MAPAILLLTVFLAGVNALGFFLMGYDKAVSRTSKAGERRIKESELLLGAILGGAFGMILGMFFFRHKTQKIVFLFGLPLLLVQQFLLLQAYWPFLSE